MRMSDQDKNGFADEALNRATAGQKKKWYRDVEGLVR